MSREHRPSLLGRRGFIGQLGKGAFGSLALPPVLSLCGGCRGRLGRQAPRCSGRVVTEDPTLCHRVRDQLQRIGQGPVDPRLREVVIIGGGASGLAAARRLLQAKVTNLLLIDKEREPGGQSRGGEIDGLRYTWAAHFIGAPHPRAGYLIDLYRELGIIQRIDDAGWPVIDPAFVLAKPYIKVQAAGSWVPHAFPFQVADKRDVDEYRRFYREMFRWATWRDEAGRPAFGTPVSLTSTADEVRALDRMTMAAYLRSKGYHSRVLAWYVDNRLINEYGTSAAQTSAWCGIHYWAASTTGFEKIEGIRLPADHRPQPVITWPEGNAFLVRGLARGLRPDQVALESLVVNVRNREDCVEVTLLDVATRRPRTVRARQVIFAAPKYMVYGMIPELRQAGRTEFGVCDYVPWLTATLVVRRAPRCGGAAAAWDNIPYRRGWSLGYISEAHVSRRPAAYRGPTVLTFYGALYNNIDSERRELLEGGWDHWARLVLHEMELMHPGISADVERLDVYKWGHGMPLPSPGYLWGAERRAMLRPQGRVHFAHSDVSGLGVFEEAVHRGIEAAQEVLARLGVSGGDALAEGQFKGG